MNARRQKLSFALVASFLFFTASSFFVASRAFGQDSNAPSQSSSDKVFYALIVGVDKYDASEFANLDGAVEDAEKLATFFNEKLPKVGGYAADQVHVTLLTNQTSEQVRKKFDEIVGCLDRNSVFVFYFAGHGICLPGMNRPSLLCRDAMKSLLFGAVSAGEISPQFITAASRDGLGDMLFLFDACRNDVFTGRGGPTKQRGMKGLCREVASKRKRDRNSGNRCTLSSCSDGERASDDGVFLDAILAEWDASLKAGDGLAVGWEFTARVSQRLRENHCRQRPEFEGVPFALTPNGKKESISFVRRLRLILAPAAVGIAIGLILLAAVLLFPKFSRLWSSKKAGFGTGAAANVFPEFGGASFDDATFKETSERTFKGVSSASPPNGKKESSDVGGRLSAFLAPATTGIAIGLILLAAVLLFPKFSRLWSPKKLASRTVATERSAPNANGGSTKIAPSTRDATGGGSTSGGGETVGAPTDSTNGWEESSIRKAGTRRTLKIGNAEYGFVWIPAGEFEMGSPESEQKGATANSKENNFEWSYSDEKRRHVKLTRGFWALETEVTQALYKEVMGTNPSGFKGDDLPVETVSWDDAVKFCAELTKRLPKGVKATLPTEAQWEYACRAGTTTPYSFGSALNGDEANCNGNRPFGTSTKGKYVEKTTPVKSYAANPWGLFDMHGNVWEWTSDYYGDYPAGTAVDPVGPAAASERAYRGGGWGNDARSCRSANRNSRTPDARLDHLGFRFLLSYD